LGLHWVVCLSQARNHLTQSTATAIEWGHTEGEGEAITGSSEKD